MAFQSSRASATRLRRALAFALPHRARIVVLSCLTVVVAVSSASEPLVLKYIFDELSNHGKIETLFLGIAGLIALGILREVASAISHGLTWKMRIGIHYTILGAMVDRLHSLPFSYHRVHGVGAIMTKLDRSIQGFLNALTQMLSQVLPGILYLSIAIYLMVQLNGKLALLVICFAPLPAIIAAIAAPEQVRRERTIFDWYVRIYARFNEVLAGILTVRSFAMEDREKERFLKGVQSANGEVIRGVGRDARFTAATNLTVLVARITAIAIGGVLLLRGEITMGTLFAFLGYVGGVFGPVQGLAGIYQTLKKASVSLEEMFSILDLEEQLPDRPDARATNTIRGDVTFENVHFAYSTNTQPILRGITFSVTAGETVAIVGPSGSGKSTLMTLLMRFYDPTQGTIRLDGTDLRDLKQDSLRQDIGVVLQEPLLFNDNVRNNIAYGRPEASLSETMAAAKAANAHDFIMNLPDQYDTVLGERGGRLSLGERQRLTIARALIKDPPLIILDEATSSLDAESEAAVQDALDRLKQGRTTFVIAHRLSTVVTADRILVLKDGQIAEAGTHDELMRHDGYYTSLVERQIQGLARDESGALRSRKPARNHHSKPLALPAESARCGA